MDKLYTDGVTSRKITDEVPSFHKYYKAHIKVIRSLHFTYSTMYCTSCHMYCLLIHFLSLLLLSLLLLSLPLFIFSVFCLLGLHLHAYPYTATALYVHLQLVLKLASLDHQYPILPLDQYHRHTSLQE